MKYRKKSRQAEELEQLQEEEGRARAPRQGKQKAGKRKTARRRRTMH